MTFTYLGHFRWLATETPESDQGVVHYFLRSRDGVKELVRREKTIIDESPDKGGVEDVLVTNVKKLELQYWDKEAEDWTDDWKADILTKRITLQTTSI